MGARTSNAGARGLITAGDWRSLRQRPLVSLGDKSENGNRHFRLSEDGRTCTVRIYGTAVTLHLPEMRGKRGMLVRAIAALAAAGEINVEFRLGGTSLSIVFDPQDLRQLPPGQTLQQDNDARLAAKGHKSRGRPRGPNYRPPPMRWTPESPRPVHPEWGPAIARLRGRVVAIDLNPNWIGLTVIQNVGDVRCLGSTKVLDHRLIHLGLPRYASRELVSETLARVAGEVLRLCETHGAGAVGMESGLGKLRSGAKGRKLNHLLNSWDRNRLSAMLVRRGGLRGVSVVEVWAGYTTTIGNCTFALPDACASAAEIGRRTLAELDWRARTRTARLNGSLPQGGMSKDLLPLHVPEVLPSLWKDSAVPKADVLERLRLAGSWVEAHRIIKSAKLGVRRPDPDIPSGSGSRASVPGFAVSRLGHRRRPGLTLRVLPAGRPHQPGQAAATNSRKTGGSPRSSR